jgi:hypothetical protein
VITFPTEKFMADYQQQAAHLDFLTNHIRNKKIVAETGD